MVSFNWKALVRPIFVSSYEHEINNAARGMNICNV